MSREIVELVVAFGAFYVAIMAVLLPILRGARKDMNQQGTELKADIKSLRTELKADIAHVETKVDKEVGDLRTELRAMNDRLDGTNMRVDRLVDALLTTPQKVS